MAVAMTQRKLIVPKDFYRTLKLRQANNDLSDEQKEEQLARRIIDAYQRLMDNFVNYVHCHKLDESRKEYGEMSQHLRPTQLILRNMIAEHRIKPGTELGNYLYNKLNYLPTLMRSIPDFFSEGEIKFFSRDFIEPFAPKPQRTLQEEVDSKRLTFQSIACVQPDIGLWNEELSGRNSTSSELHRIAK